MRILHTSDWHLGKGLMGYSRTAEHEQFCEEVIDLAQDVDLVIVSGDVFDTYNPPIDAEEMLYDTLARLGDGGKRAVVVIAGNHDSPDRLSAPNPLAVTHGVFLFGRPGDEAARTGTRRGQIGVVHAGPSTLRLDLPSGERACIVALPYPSEARLKAVLSESLDERDLQSAYQEKLRRVFHRLGEVCFEPDGVNLITSHLTLSQCLPSESERALVGGAYQIDAAILPEQAQYVALGHLHRPQDVEGAPVHTRYAGAPLAFRISERDVARTHTLVEVEPGGTPTVEEIPVQAGRPMVLWEAEGGLDEVTARIEAGELLDAFIDLRLHTSEPLTHTQLGVLRRLPRDFLRIRTVLPAGTTAEAADPGEIQAPAELFKAFVREQTEADPDPELVALFEELSQAAMEAR